MNMILYSLSPILKLYLTPAPVAQWLALRTVGRKVWGSNPIRVMRDFSALASSYPELGVLRAQWEGWNHTAELHPFHGCIFEGVALITWPTLQVPQFPGLVNTGIIMTGSVVCGPVIVSSSLKPKWISTASSVIILILIDHCINKCFKKKVKKKSQLL